MEVKQEPPCPGCTPNGAPAAARPGKRQGVPARLLPCCAREPSDRDRRSHVQRTEQLSRYIKKFPRTAVKEQPQHPNTLIVSWTLAELPLTHKPTALEILQLGIKHGASELVHLVTHTRARDKKHLQFKALTDSRTELSSFKNSSYVQSLKHWYQQIDFLASTSRKQRWRQSLFQLLEGDFPVSVC